jgi:acyl transferase domain-containing protein/NADPH:quinone reductase-like Zn-dependent oxidoreductase
LCLQVDDTHNFLKSRGLSGHHQTVLPTGEPALVADADSGFNSSASGSEGGDTESSTPKFKLFVFSSVDPAGLQRNATALAHQIGDALSKDEQDEPGVKPAEPESDVDAKFLEDLVYTLATRRSLFDQRAFVVARSSKDLQEQLSKPLQKTRRGATNSNIFFTFTGQGAQWASMGAALRVRAPFRQSLSRAEAQLASLGCKWSLIDELIATKDTSRIDEPYLSQPLCTALQLALVDLAAEWKITPRAVVGHSSGEIAAAYAAGYLSHEDAMTVAYWRGVLSADVNNRLQGKTGAMMAVGLSETDVQPYLDKVPLHTVVVACINSPSSVTLSGDKDKVAELETIFQEAGIFARKLRVKTAYHSPHMSTIADDYLAAIAGIETLDGSKRVTMFSSVTGKVLDPTELKPSYWVANMLGTVRFSSAVAALLSQPANPEAKGARRKAVVRYSAVVELGPAEALKGPLVQVMNGINSRLTASVPYTTLLSRNVDAEQSALAGAAYLWAHGLNVDLDRINFPLGSNEPLQSLASLPPYQWNHNKIFHHESAWGKKYLKRSKPRTDLLGMRLDNADNNQPRWHNYIRLSEQPWMGDHRVQQMIVYPGAAMAVQAIEGSRELATPSRAIRAVEVRNILFKRGLLVPPGDAFVETAIHFEPATAASADETCWSFKIFSQSGEETWGQICSGQVATLYEHNDFGEGERAWKHDLTLNADIRQRACRDIAPKSFYRLFDQKMNLQYGPLHRNVTACVAGTEEGYGEVTIPDTKSVMPANFEYPHLIHPATLDSCFHLQALGYLHSLSGEESLVPISVEKIYIDANISTAAGTVFSGYSKGVQGQGGDTIGDIVLSDDQASSPKIVVRGFLSRDLSASTPVGNAMSADVRTRKCTVMQYVLLDAPPSEEEAASVEVVEMAVKAEADNNIEDTADNSTSKDEGSKTVIAEEIVVLHGSAAYQDPKCAPAVEELRLALEPHCKTLTNIAMGDLTGSETSQVQGKIVLSLIEVEERYVSSWSEPQFKAFRDVVSAASSVLWLTRGAKAETESGLSFAATTGLLRTVRVEKPQLRLFQLSLAPGSSTLSMHDLALTIRVMTESVLSSATRLEQEYVEVDGELHVPRLVTDESFHSELNPVGAIPELTTQEVSQLDGPVRGLVPRFSETIRFQAQELAPLGSGDVEVSPTMVTVDAAAFEHRETLGQDAVGVVTAIGDSITQLAVGDRVVVSASETMQFPLRVSCGCVELLPSFINAAAAVTMPTPLTLAQLALVDLGHTAPGQTVLIVGSPDPIGLALIQLADSLGARVFASFENERHRNLLLDHVDLDEQQLIRTTNGIEFADKLRRLNAGRGVDVLIVSTPGDITHQSSSCLAPFGRCVTVGSRQHLATSAPFERGVTISNLDLEHLRRAAPAKVAKAFKQVWARARTGAFHSMLPRRSLDISMFTETHTIPTSVCRPGGAVISIREDSKLVLLPPPPPTLTLDPEATYVLAGGLGGIGRSIAETMVSAGARNLAFISRSGAKADEAKKLLNSLQLRGCTAKAYSCDASSSAAVEAYVKAATERGERIKGVVQCAMVLRDSVFDNMTFEQWTESTRPKIQGSWNLHTHFPKDMDFFIMLSSMAGVIGNPGKHHLVLSLYHAHP